jgi:sugar phosphate isomerase/epimerase
VKTQPQGRDHLVASFYTLSGAPNGQPARYSFEDRLRAARRAGWAGIGLASFDYQVLLKQHSRDELRSTAAKLQLPVAEIEFLPFGLDRENTGPSEGELLLYDMADVFGSRQLNVTLAGSYTASDDEVKAARGLSAVGDAAAEHGLTVAFEFMPFAAVKSLEAAARIIERAERENVGALVDAYHFFRGGSRIESIRTLSPGVIAGIQLDDAPADVPDDLLTETREHRLLPGEGALDLVTLLEALADIGADVPIGVEVLSNDLRKMSVDEAASRAFKSTAAVCAAARASESTNEPQGLN